MLKIVVVTVALALLLALVVIFVVEIQCGEREANARHLLKQLAAGAEQYALDQDQYPPGNGAGSAEFYFYLKSCRKCKGPPYFEFRPGHVDSSGNILSPVRAGDIVHYRRNALRPGASRGGELRDFDLWCRDCSGRDHGVNNWE